MNITTYPSKVAEVLKKYKTIAVVGMSSSQERDSYKVAKYLQEVGYKIILVNPGLRGMKILGETCRPSLRSVEQPIEIVDIFRKPEYVPEIVDEAIEVGAKVVWMQLGVVNEEAAKKAVDAGLMVVMDKCIKLEHNWFVTHQML